MIGREHGSASAPATEHADSRLGLLVTPTSGASGSPRRSPSSAPRSACWPCPWWPSRCSRPTRSRSPCWAPSSSCRSSCSACLRAPGSTGCAGGPSSSPPTSDAPSAWAGYPVAWQLGILTIEQLYVVGFVTGVLTVFFDVSYQSYLPSLVERDRILEGNSKLEVSRTVAQTAGPALGGGLIGIVGAPLAIIADAISYLGSALFVGRIERREPKPDAHLDAHGQPRVGVRRGGRRGTAVCARQSLPAVDRGHDRQSPTCSRTSRSRPSWCTRSGTLIWSRVSSASCSAWATWAPSWARSPRPDLAGGSGSGRSSWPRRPSVDRRPCWSRSPRWVGRSRC